ncbi:4Fe-4S cluster-binding domain-containing protein [Bradyrhizobium sp. B097]|uniref:4Fe-4S cluster-binding domain-containing protein n=1 Tax=Bradyrhizobium sp. B097 TaxID=3140244 RepID=UPI0031830F0C
MINTPDFERIKAMVLDCSSKIRVRKYGCSVVTLSPVEVTNRCASNCDFCGWRADNTQMGRVTIDEELVDIQTQYLLEKGVQDIELVGGDDIRFVRVLPALLRRLRSRLPTGVSHLLFSTMALTELQYQTLAACGADGVIMWQETYDESVYNHHISRGPKACGIDEEFRIVKNGNGFLFRLQSQDRAAQAGLALSVGSMLGLNKDVAFDVLATIHHARYLCTTYAPVRPLIIGMPTWNEITTPETDKRPEQILDIEKCFSFFASLYLLALSDLNIWVFPTCRVSMTAHIEAVRVAGAYTSTEVKTGPGGYLVDALRNADSRVRQTITEKLHGKFGEESISANALLKRLDEIEQFKHYHYPHETFARALAVAGIKIANRDGAGTLSAV